MFVMNHFFSRPLEVRVAAVLVLLLILLLLGFTPILKIFSLLPLFLKQVFRALYLLLDLPVFALHKLLGGGIYHIDNGLAMCGKKIDFWLEHWYQAWHVPKSRKKYAAVATVVCIVCYLSITASTFLHVKSNGWILKCQTVYLHMEGSLVDFLEARGWYDPSAPVFLPDTDQPEENSGDNQNNTLQTPLTVFRVSNVLRIRDIPSTKNSTTLDTVKNGGVVLWNGQLTFGLAEGKQEAWVKVTTETGVEGWGRLYYLRPEEGMELNLVVTDADNFTPTEPVT